MGRTEEKESCDAWDGSTVKQRHEAEDDHTAYRLNFNPVMILPSQSHGQIVAVSTC